MSRRHQLLTPADLTVLASHGECAEVLDEDRTWARAAHERWGFCGVVCGTPEQPRAWLLVAPAHALPSSHPLSQRSRTPDAAGLVALHHGVDDRWAVRHLVQTTAARLVGRAECLEALGHLLVDDCATPRVSALEAAGFVRCQDESSLDVAVRMRLDLDRTLLERVRKTVRAVVGRSWAPIAPPEPSHRERARV